MFRLIRNLSAGYRPLKLDSEDVSQGRFAKLMRELWNTPTEITFSYEQLEDNELGVEKRRETRRGINILYE